MPIPQFDEHGLLPFGIHRCGLGEIEALRQLPKKRSPARAMIENDEQLRQAAEAIGDLYQALASSRSRILPVNPRNYRLVAQGPLDEIRKIQADIDTYLGLGEPVMAAEAMRETRPDPHTR